VEAIIYLVKVKEQSSSNFNNLLKLNMCIFVEIGWYNFIYPVTVVCFSTILNLCTYIITYTNFCSIL